MNTYHLRLNDVDDFVPQFAEKLGIGFKSNLGEFTVMYQKIEKLTSKQS